MIEKLPNSIRPHSRKLNPSHGFTLVELIVAIAIIGILMGMLFPAVQLVRESARRVNCQSKLKNIGLALLSYESANAVFPHGSTFRFQHSWGSAILPWLDQKAHFDAIDFDQDWNAAGQNAAIVMTDLPVFHCPSSGKRYPGKTDYCGISGSFRNFDFSMNRNGILFPAFGKKTLPVRMRSITDGTSQTIAVSEGVRVLELDYGFWACGLNCFNHGDGRVNEPVHLWSDEIISEHPGGANAALCDGSVQFIGEQVDADTVAALCTRNGQEVNVEF